MDCAKNRFTFMLFHPPTGKHSGFPRCSVGLLTHRSDYRDLFVIRDFLVREHMQTLYQFASQRLQQATWGCQPEMQRNHTCHVSLDWSGGQAQQLVQAANAAIQAVDPSGAVCFLNSAKTAPCQGWHGPSGACRYTTGAGQPSLYHTAGGEL